ncbi:MAG: helix-turn-helix domain-containing protein [Brachybacterium sp.]|uniref:helix-turn-helix domain-containing protein n=1 Tax=unclassified Brachybacterium TaxID=2623841 RepID=UPI003FDACAF7
MAHPRSLPAAGAALDRMLDALEHEESLVPEISSAIRTALPGYGEVPSASLEASIHRNIDLSIRTVRRGASPDAEQIAEAEELAVERMGQGVPLGSVLAGFRLCMTEILDRLRRLAPAHGLPAEEVLVVATLLWSLGDSFSTRAVIGHQERSIAQAVADSGRRSRWLIEAVMTGLPRTELLSGAAAYGVPGEAPARALIAAPSARQLENWQLENGQPENEDRSDAADTAHRLQDWAARAGVEVLSTPHGMGEVGLVLGEPAVGVDPEGLSLALGPPGPLARLPESFVAASRVQTAAARVGHRGLADLGTLSWRMGITASPEATELLRRRRLEPLRAEGAFGQLLQETVRAYLAHGLNIPRAAASIPVHVNTLRYRLKRFQELTGADLHEPEHLIEVSWALAAEPEHGRPAGSPTFADGA